jgi:hypothetical protein
MIASSRIFLLYCLFFTLKASAIHQNLYEEKGGKTLFHVFAGGQQVCTFEAGSPLKHFHK